MPVYPDTSLYPGTALFLGGTAVGVDQVSETEAAATISAFQYKPSPIAVITAHERETAKVTVSSEPYVFEASLPEATFADRIYEQLAPFAALDTNGHLRVLADGIGEMFKEVEQLSSTRDDGLSGYANLLDLGHAKDEWLDFLAQFVGVRMLKNLPTSERRNWIRDVGGYRRARRGAIISAAQRTLTGSQQVFLRERIDGSAWHWAVITRSDETPDPAVTRTAVLSQKPAYDIVDYSCVNGIDYQWIKDNYATYTAVKGDNASYDDLRQKEF